MKVSQGEQVQSQVVLNIEVDLLELEEHLEKVYRQAVRRMNIPGFRKGKAPRSVVERELGRDAMIEDALETLLPQMTSKAIEEQSLDVISTPQVKVTQHEPLTIEATVPVRPQVDLGDYYQYRLEPEEVEVTSEAIDEVVASLRRDAGTWEPVERLVELDDMVTMEVRGQVEEDVIIEDEGVDYVLLAEATNPTPGFAEQLVGMNRENIRQFSLPFPEDYPQDNLAGKECNFTVTVKEIKELKMPDLDDEFAQTLNLEVETVAALKDKLRADMLKRDQTLADQHYQERTVQTLVEGAQVELPPLLIDHEIEHILADQGEAMQRQQMSMEDYLSTVGKSVEQLREELRPSATERITRSLVMSALREKEGIDVTPEEIEEELNSMVREATRETESLKQILDTENGRASINSILINRKVLNLLTSITKGETIVASSSRTETLSEEDKGESEEGAENA
ncbi:MAG: trigger factor [Dehalococcoidia bacterium]|nr:trigger factor [Dehalococcoidia bacterium]